MNLGIVSGFHGWQRRQVFMRIDEALPRAEKLNWVPGISDLVMDFFAKRV